MSDTGETINSDFSMKIGKRDVEAFNASRAIRKAIERGDAPNPEDVRKASQGQPINPGDVYIAPEITDVTVGYMMDANSVSSQMCPSVKVAKQKGSYPVFSKSFFFRDEMEERGDAQAAAEGTMGLTFNNYACPVYAWRLPLGAQARANATPLDLDRAGGTLCGNKAILKRDILWFNKFFTSGAAWSTKLQLKTSGGGGTAGIDLSFKDATALPIKQIKAQLDVQSGLTGGRYRCNKAVWSRDVWTAFCEHPNVISRINSGQTPGGPAEATQAMVAAWLGLEKIVIADTIQTTSAKGVAEASATYSRVATGGQILFAYVPDAPSQFEPSAMYSFDWVPPDSLVGGYGAAVASYYVQDRKAQMYEVEMSTDPELVSADCGVLLYNCLA